MLVNEAEWLAMVAGRNGQGLGLPSQFRCWTERQAALALVEFFEAAVAGAFLAANRLQFNETTARQCGTGYMGLLAPSLR